MDNVSKSILILGIGNILLGDEAFGVRAAETLHAQYDLPSEVEIMDGGTQGLLLLPIVQATQELIIFDAIDFKLPAASLKIIRDQDVPHYLAQGKLSPHQVGFQEILSLCNLLGQSPEKITLIGVQPLGFQDGAPLSPEVAAQIPAAITACLKELELWGIKAKPRLDPPPQGLLSHGLDDRKFFQS